MSKRDYHVVPRSKGWAVEKEGNKRASSVHENKQDALKAGRTLAKEAKTELVIHNSDGKIANSNSFGNDPCPPKDRKH